MSRELDEAESRGMRALAGELLLTAWEEGAAEHELGRALTMLSAALPDTGRVRLGALPIGERNLLLLRLHELSFGPMLNVFGVCPKCAGQFEFAVPAAVMIAQLDAQSPASQVAWSEAGRQYRLRAVTTDDLLASLRVPDTSAAQELLLARCLDVSPPLESGRPAAPAAVRQQFEELNAAAELSCSVDCPRCSTRELVDFDVARFVWAEVRRAARGLLREIHELASAYGWSERAIARMGTGRRTAYLELAGT